MNNNNLKNILVFAPKRSGHHGIITWICNEFEKKDNAVLHINDVDLKKFIEDKKVKSNSNRLAKYVTYNNNENKKPNLLLFNFEEQPILKYKDKILNPPDNTKVVFVLRDLYNLLASRMKGFTEKINDDVFNKWLWFVKLYTLAPDNFILFDKWFESKKYRENVFEKIFKEPLICDNTNIMSRHGGGSSFTGLKYNGNTSKMNVTNRWKLFKHNEEYLKWVKKYKDLFLNNKIFDDNGRYKELIEINKGN